MLKVLYITVENVINNNVIRMIVWAAGIWALCIEKWLDLKFYYQIHRTPLFPLQAAVFHYRDFSERDITGIYSHFPDVCLLTIFSVNRPLAFIITFSLFREEAISSHVRMKYFSTNGNIMYALLYQKSRCRTPYF